MNLILINFSDEESLLFISNLQLERFVAAWGDGPIRLVDFYGYNREKYFYNDSVRKCDSLVDLKKFIDENNISVINNIVFDSNSYNIEISDLYDYTIKKTGKDSSFLPYILKKCIGFDVSLVPQQDYLNKYLLVDRQRIIKVFSTFDEYLNSDVDEESNFE
jgi:hypothetical protein